MARSTPNEVADYLLCKARGHGDNLSPLKLQKLMFYADAWHMVMKGGEQLIDDHFEAWVHGPVLRSIYFRFNHYRWKPILDDIECPELGDETSGFLDEVYQVFGGFSGFELEQLTHQELPWKEARADLPPDALCTTPISKETTVQFYRSMSAG